MSRKTVTCCYWGYMLASIASIAALILGNYGSAYFFLLAVLMLRDLEWGYRRDCWVHFIDNDPAWSDKMRRLRL